ncbi:MAG TPA: VCBS domain-containing protein [Leptolyngbyaceae cyanobacterium]
MNLDDLLNSKVTTDNVNDPAQLNSLQNILLQAGIDGEPDKGTSGSDTYDYTDSSVGEKVNAGGGNDLVLGSSRNDSLSGNGNNDVVIGNAGNDLVKGDGGNDIVQGGAGSDEVLGQGGNDHLIYQLSENLNGESDSYDGGVDSDTLWLAMTNGEYAKYASVIAEMRAFVAANSNITTDSGARKTFNFVDPATGKTSALTIQDIEKIELLITNSAAAIIGATSGNVIEDVDPNNNGLLEASGKLIISDKDHLDDRFVASTQSGMYGTFRVLDEAGNWTYTANNSQPAIQQLGNDDNLQEIFTVTSIDGTQATFTLTITGVNDAIEVGVVDLSGVVTEDATTPALSDSGTIAFADVDLSDAHVASAAFKSSTHGAQLGTLSAAVTSDTTGTGTGGQVTWNFKVDNAAVQFLGSGDSVTETHTVTLTDNEGSTVTRDVVVTLTGVNDAPVIGTGDAIGSVTEGTGPVGSVFTIDFNAINGAASYSEDGFTFTATGNHTDSGNQLYWHDGGANPGDNDIIMSFGGAPFSILSMDILSQSGFQIFTNNGTFTASQTGTNIAVGLNNITTATFETNDWGAIIDNLVVSTQAILSDSGTINFSDADLTDSHTVSILPKGGSYLGAFSANVANASTGDSTGQIAWNFQVADSAVNYLAAGQKVIQTYTIAVNDGKGGVDTEDVSVTITGVNDAPIVKDPLVFSATENNAAFTINLLQGASDVDTTDILSAGTVNFTAVKQDGTSIAAVGVTQVGNSLTIDPKAYQALLKLGESVKLTGSYVISDNSLASNKSVPQTVTINISGLNNNFSFENGNFTDWTTLGSAVVSTGGVGATNGTYFAEITSLGATDSELETFLGVNTGSIDAITNGGATNGAAIKLDDLFLHAGQKITFDWLFKAGDYLPFDDNSFFTTLNGKVSELADVTTVGSYGSSGWRTTSLTVTNSGVYDFGFGVVNSQDQGFHSTLYVDNLTIS